MTRTAAGTDGYIAPEVLGGAPFTAAADIYSLGITAIELLTGTRNPLALATLPGLPNALAQGLKQMTHADPSNRPTTAVLAGWLAAMLKPQPPKPKPPQPAPSTTPWGALAVGGLALGGALLALVALAGDNKSEWDANVKRYRDADGKFTKH